MHSYTSNSLKHGTKTIAIAALVLGIASVAPAQAAQTRCLFEIQQSDQGTFGVDLPVRITANGRRATAAVSGSGTYKARVRRVSGTGAEYVFSTSSSREVITIGTGGETLWQIDFTDGRWMAYVGQCTIGG